MMCKSDRRSNWWMSAVASCAVATGVTGCGEEDLTSPECTPGSVCGTTGTTPDGGLTGTTGTTTGSTAGTTGIQAGTTTGTQAGTTTGMQAGTTTGTPSSAGNGLPCDVAEVLDAKCGSCHGAEVAGGAPMALASLADLMAPLPSNAGMTAADGVLDRIHEEDVTRRMPPAGLPELTAEELAILDGWLNAGAPASSDTCETDSGDVDGGGDKPPVAHDPTLDCYEFRAHDRSSKDTPYPVGSARDKYINFTFNAPWSGTVYGREYNIILDNKAAVHHWLLFKNAGPGVDGEVDDSSGTHPDGELLYGWAPGGNSLNFAEFGDIGMVMEGGVSYTLELHYNSSDAAAKDRSGVEVCVTPDEPAETAGTSWVGSDAIFGSSVTGVCRPAGQTEPIRLLGISPHMHKKGRHMKSIIHRADGSMDMLHDKPFDFNYQTYYFVDDVLMPGDYIETTCTFSEFATFGTSTDAEMCYMFTVHSPAGALTDNGPAGIFAHGANACLGL